MGNKNTVTYKNSFIQFFFILTTFICIVKLDSNLYIPTDCFYHPNQTRIELVVSEQAEYNVTFNTSSISQGQETDFTLAHVDFSSINKFLLIQYSNYVLHQLKSFKYFLIPNQQLVSILQNKNIRHQSPDEDFPLFS